MKFSYQFNHLCGTVYTQGNVVFTPDGNSLLSPVGNRITQFDLINHTSKTFTFESRKDISCLAVSNDSRILIAVDKDGRCLLVNLKKGIVLYRFNFKKPVKTLVFSRDDKYIAVAIESKVQVWYTPSLGRELAPFTHYRTYGGHSEDVISINWSEDSKFFVTGSKDLTSRIFSLESYPNFHPATLAGHRDYVIGAYFANNDTEIYTVGRDGGSYIWNYRSIDLNDGETSSEETDEIIPEMAKGVKWSTVKKHVFKMNYCKVKCCTFHPKIKILVLGFSNGTFGIYEMPDYNNIHTLSISNNQISSVNINSSGEWLAFASKKLGQLLVWEWQSETYVLKQQGHYFDLNVLDYSPDGQIIATGSDDSKLKLWNTTTGFCFVTFSEHTAPVTGVVFSDNGQVVVSSSLDGTVRAYDLNRYKNFRTLTTPDPVQFMSLAIDPSGQIVCAGSLEPFNIYIWSLQTGRLIDIFSGHEGPITSLSFSPSTSDEPLLASGSWDHTVRIWNVYKNKSFIEPLDHSSDVLAVAFRPDGRQVCTATLNGSLNLWAVADGKLEGVIEGGKDVSGGRRNRDLITAKNNSISKHFTSVCYSADGTCVLAGGRSRFVCIYETSHQLLLKKFQISHNRSLEGVLDILNSAHMTEAGPQSLLQNGDSEDETNDRKIIGAKRAVDPGSRRQHLEVLTKCVKFSPTGRAWAAASTEGLLIYTLDENTMFDPFDLDEDITPASIRHASHSCEYTKSILMSLHLNEENLIKECLENTPVESIPWVAQSMKNTYIERLFNFLSKQLEQSSHLEFYLRWIQSLLHHHGNFVHEQYIPLLSSLRSLQKATAMHLNDLSKTCNENLYTLDYLRNMSKLETQRKKNTDQQEMIE